ncbi:MAG: hypothetical protein ACI91G_000953 [Gammaproteobacteria bacterium]|jgi:hypothetical protein
MFPVKRIAPSDALKRLDKLASLLDSQISIPGTKIRFGLDAILGLVPGIGDVAGAILSLWIVFSGLRMGATPPTVFKMLLNVGIELILGAIPVVGDMFDVVWQSNNRNVALLRQELAPTPPDVAGDRDEKPHGQQNLLALLALIILIGVVMSALGYQ